MKKVFQFTIVEFVILYGVTVALAGGLHNFFPGDGEDINLSGGYISMFIAGLLLTAWVLVRGWIKNPELEEST